MAIASVTLKNIGATTQTNPQVRFAHGFKLDDVPAGNRLVLALPDGTPVPYTPARISSRPNGSLWIVDLLAKLPNGVGGPTILSPSGTLVLTISAEAGAFNTTLPASKTVANIVTDITTNHDTIGMELVGLLNSSYQQVGSGTWTADSTTAFGLTAPNGGYRCVATGPTAADFVAWMMIRDPNNGYVTHSSLWAQFYITAFLNSATGAVEKLCWRAWLNQGIYGPPNDTYDLKLRLKVGSNVVRSWGFAADGRDMTFAPSAVNTSNATITLPGHGFTTTEKVQFSSTGTLPGGISAVPNYSYWLRRVDANTIQLYTNQFSTPGYGSPISLSNQGTGTHRINGHISHVRFQFQCLAGVDGQFDWSSGHSGALDGGPLIYTIHNSAYYIRAAMAPAIDLSVNMLNATEPNPQRFAPGTNGAFHTNYSDPGARIDLSGIFNEWACRSLRYRNDYAGYVQTARVHALDMGCWPQNFVNPSTMRMPVLKAGTYAGLGTAVPSWSFFDIKNTATGSLYNYDFDDYSHHTMAIYPVYIFEGGQDLLDLINIQTNYVFLYRSYSSGYSTQKNPTWGGRTYWTFSPSTQPRQDAWGLCCLVDSMIVSPDGSPERAYFNDIFRDTADALHYMIYVMGPPTWRDAGGWEIGEMQKALPGVPYYDNNEDCTNFMQSFIGYCWAYNYIRTRDPVLRDDCLQMAAFFRNLWINFPTKAYSITYAIKTKLGPRAGFVDYSPWQDFGIIDAGAPTWTFNADSTVSKARDYNYPDIPLQLGDRVYFTSSGQGTMYAWPNPGQVNSPPAPVSLYTWYYVRGITRPGGIDTFRLSTTNDDANLLSWTTSVVNTKAYNDVQNRTTGQPTLIYRHNTGVSNSDNGHLTLAREACGYLYLAGVLPIAAFQATDAFFQLEDTGDNMAGPNGFKTNIFESVDVSVDYSLNTPPPTHARRRRLKISPRGYR